MVWQMKGVGILCVISEGYWVGRCGVWYCLRFDLHSGYVEYFAWMNWGLSVYSKDFLFFGLCLFGMREAHCV